MSANVRQLSGSHCLWLSRMGTTAIFRNKYWHRHKKLIPQRQSSVYERRGWSNSKCGEDLECEELDFVDGRFNEKSGKNSWGQTWCSRCEIRWNLKMGQIKAKSSPEGYFSNICSQLYNSYFPFIQHMHIMGDKEIGTTKGNSIMKVFQTLKVFQTSWESSKNKWDQIMQVSKPCITGRYKGRTRTVSADWIWVK